VPEHLVNAGSFYVPGTASHHLSLYRHSSGALVFGAGSVQWVWGLDMHHDTDVDLGASTPDANIRQATINLLGDMGVQPATLQGPLAAAQASTDFTAPTSTITSPSAAACVMSGSIVTITGTASDLGGGVVGGVEVS